VNPWNNTTTLITIVEGGPVLRILRLGNAGPEIEVQGLTLGRSYAIEASANLRDWIELTRFQAIDMTMAIHDAAAWDFTQRYYRAAAAQ
jgi:hypothetical protein